MRAATLLVLRFHIAPRRRELARSVDVAPKMRGAQSRARAIQGDIFYLVIVDDVGFRRGVRPGVGVLFSRGAVCGDDAFEIDDCELAGLCFTPQYIEACVVQFRLGGPPDDDFAGGYVSCGSEACQGDGQGSPAMVSWCADIISIAVIGCFAIAFCGSAPSSLRRSIRSASCHPQPCHRRICVS